jgi:hypothetical protein
MERIMADSPTFKIAINNQRFVEKPGRELDWDTFNDGFRNWEIDIMRFCNAIFLGHPYCPWMEGRRKVENFKLAQHIAVDMDCGDKRASIEVLCQHPLVLTYGAIIHETPSHTPDVPRARVIFVLDEPITTAAGYKVAIQTVTELFDGSDPACVDSARFFFGNGRLKAEGRTEGIWFNPDACLPLSELRRLASLRLAKQKEATKENRGQWVQRAPSADSRPNAEQMSLNELRDSLSKVHPYAMGYQTWLKLIAAIRHCYGNGAFGLVKAWSDVPNEKPLTESKWNSLSDSHPDPAGYGTIVQIVQELAR